MANNTSKKTTERLFSKTNSNGKYIGVQYSRVKKVYNKETRDYDVLGSIGCTIYGTKKTGELHIQTGLAHLYATKVEKDGSINLTTKGMNEHGLDDASTEYKTANKKDIGKNARKYLLDGLNFKTMKFETLYNIYIEGLKDIYEAEHKGN